ncbi:MAG TPA: hypothetical protein VEJ63_19465, partial [Planctomycetota bacterium]|nr:hypothetical protein [Planctomycetota bacterium]
MSGAARAHSSRPYGTRVFGGRRFPALKRRAIFNRPYGTNGYARRGPQAHGHVSKNDLSLWLHSAVHPRSS